MPNIVGYHTSITVKRKRKVKKAKKMQRQSYARRRSARART